MESTLVIGLQMIVNTVTSPVIGLWMFVLSEIDSCQESITCFITTWQSKFADWIFLFGFTKVNLCRKSFSISFLLSQSVLGWQQISLWPQYEICKDWLDWHILAGNEEKITYWIPFWTKNLRKCDAESSLFSVATFLKALLRKPLQLFE